MKTTTKFKWIYPVLAASLFGILSLTSCNKAPSCSITYPSDQQVILLGDDVTITIDASDKSGLFQKGISSVSVYIDDNLMEELTSEPYSYTWNTSDVTAGSHTIRVKAEDSGNKSSEKQITVIINDPPAVSITSPTSTDIYIGGTVDIIASASDEIGGITKVEFLIDDTLKQTVTTSPYSYSWNTTGLSAGSVTIKAKAYDSYGATSVAELDATLLSSIVGTWAVEYSGDDPANSYTLLTCRRRLKVNPDKTYVDSLYGEPSDKSSFIMYQYEKGTWSTSSDLSVVLWSPTEGQKIDLSTNTYDAWNQGDHSDNINLETTTEGMGTKWTGWTDSNLSVNYDMLKIANTKKK